MLRRGFLTGAAAFAAMTTGARAHHINTALAASSVTPPSDVRAMYAAQPGERFSLPAVDVGRLDPRYWRQRVRHQARWRPGTLVVDTSGFHLYLIEPNGWAMRYGVSLGRAGLAWAGSGVIQFKRQWPTWTPTKNMIRREPKLRRWRTGMPPGLSNPLGARALYIYEGGVDTLYRIHGTPQPYTIGTAASAGCVRMINQDVIDLYGRVRPGAQLVVS